MIAAVTVQLIGWRPRHFGRRRSLARAGFHSGRSSSLPSLHGFSCGIGGEWVGSKEGWDDVDEEPTWLGIGGITADAGGLLLLVWVILAGIGARRLGGSNGEQGATLVRIATVLAAVLVIAYVIATWAMSAKPD